MDFKLWVEQQLFYRGTPQEEREAQSRDFPGVFVTTNSERAQSYGEHVGTYRLKQTQKWLDSESPQAPRLVHYFNRKFGDFYDNEMQRKWQKTKNMFRANPMSLGATMGSQQFLSNL